MHLFWGQANLICASLVSDLVAGAKAGQIPLASSPGHAAYQACHTLAPCFPDLVSLPNDPRYQSQQDLYWAANQADLTPACRLSPTTSEEVGSLISQLISFDYDVQFAISSGGHATAFGASNLNDGITLDLSRLNTVSLAPDRSYVDIGTGARWLDVYQMLDPVNLTVAGGRAGSVGVGGYLLGGGISLFSSLHGWGADSLGAIEVVLPNGTHITTTTSAYSDLFTCLKGGANNFGIATSFRLKTIPVPDGVFDVSFLGYTHEQLPDVLAALADFNKNAHLDPASASAELSIGFGFDVGQGPVHVLMLARLGLPDSPPPEKSGVGDAVKNLPALWKPFFDIPVLYTSLWRANMGYLAQQVEADNPYGFRVYKNTMTIVNNGLLLNKIADIFTNAIREISNRTDGEGGKFQAGMLVQPLPLPHLHHAREQGQTNLMGLEDESEPLIMLAFEVHYLGTTADARFIALLDDMISRAEALAILHFALHPFRYVNYAARGQDVWAVMREQGRLADVKKVMARYDIEGIWERKLRGGFRFE